MYNLVDLKTKQNTELDKKCVQKRTTRKHLCKMALRGVHEKKVLRNTAVQRGGGYPPDQTRNVVLLLDVLI